MNSRRASPKRRGTSSTDASVRALLVSSTDELLSVIVPAYNVQERGNGETRRRSRVAQVFQSVASLERLARAVMCDMDKEWQDARYFSKRKMDELYDESRAAGAEESPTPERLGEWRLVAERAIDASLEFADEMETA